MVVGVLGPVVVVEELGGGWPAAVVAALVATAAAYWLICCIRFRIKSGGRAPTEVGIRLLMKSEENIKIFKDGEKKAIQ